MNTPRLFRVTLATRRFLITAPDEELAHAWTRQRFGDSVASLRELTDTEHDLLALDLLRLAFGSDTQQPPFTLSFRTGAYELQGYGPSREAAATDLLVKMLTKFCDVDVRVFAGLAVCLGGRSYQCEEFSMELKET